MAGVGGGRDPALRHTQELLSREFQPSPAFGAFSEAIRLCGVPGEQTPQLALKEHQRVQEQLSSTIQQGQQQKPARELLLPMEKLRVLAGFRKNLLPSDPGQPWSTLLGFGGVGVVVTPWRGFGREQLEVSPESLGSPSQDERAPSWPCSETRARLAEDLRSTLAVPSPPTGNS